VSTPSSAELPGKIHTDVPGSSVFWAANKKENDPIAPRHVAVTKKNAVKVKVIGTDAPAKAYTEDRPKHPKNKDLGTKKVAFGPELLLDQADAKELKVGEEITLMAWGNAIVREISSSDPVTGVTVELHLQGDVKKTEKKLTWLAASQELVNAEVWDFDYLLTKDKLEEEDNMEDFLTETTATMEEAWVDAAAAELKVDTIIQLERKNYCRVDQGLSDGKVGEEKKLVLFCIPTGGKSKGLG
jgi:glutamyl-tRNA synthetase